MNYFINESNRVLLNNLSFDKLINIGAYLLGN